MSGAVGRSIQAKFGVAFAFCATNVTLKRISLDDLRELVETPLDDGLRCLDLDECVKTAVGDSDVRQHLLERYGIADSIKGARTG